MASFTVSGCEESNISKIWEKSNVPIAIFAIYIISLSRYEVNTTFIRHPYDIYTTLLRHPYDIHTTWHQRCTPVKWIGEIVTTQVVNIVPFRIGQRALANSFHGSTLSFGFAHSLGETAFVRPTYFCMIHYSMSSPGQKEDITRTLPGHLPDIFSRLPYFSFAGTHSLLYPGSVFQGVSSNLLLTQGRLAPTRSQYPLTWYTIS